jgi:5-methylthioadenosine/S-adenosylhomocysteine deaminase
LSEGLISGMGETMSLYEWADRLIRPVLQHLNREMARAGAMVKAAEMIRSGITTVNDMFVHFNPGSYASLGVADGLDEVGLGGVICFGPKTCPIGCQRPRFSMSTRLCATASGGQAISASG